MTKQRDSATYFHILKIGDHMKKTLDDSQIQFLRNYPNPRTSLYKEYAEKGLLNPSEGSRMEQLPIYVFLMAPKTKNAYLEAWKAKKMATGGALHENILKASLENDDDVAEVIEQKTNGKIDSMWLRMAIRAIQKSRNWREDVMGISRVSTLEDIPNGAFLACYEKIPDFSTIQEKRLTCAVMDPSPESENLINQMFPNRIQPCIKGYAIGRRGSSIQCKVFGPEVVQCERGRTPNSISLAALFFYAKFNSRGAVKEKIYVVDGFF
uniref:KH_dom_type_1 domain-containing protein n=1 Tax=Caenorhabditis tropicalis TaxID=1561998 RepID=A0A1I7T7D2_9PELO